MKNARRVFLTGLALLLACGLAGCRRTEAPRTALARRHWTAMSTVVSLALPREMESSDRQRAQSLAREALEEVERELSLFRPDSDLARLNRAAGNDSVSLGTMAGEVLAEALRVAQSSRGAFDPTIGPLMTLWGFRGDAGPSWPTPEQLRQVRLLVGWSNVWLEAASGGEGTGASWTASLAREGCQVDLGAIAKGYAVDRACQSLDAAGLQPFLLDLGGNIRCRGRPEPRRDWRIGVRNPFSPHETVGTLTLRDGEALATSGGYERFVEIDGRRLGHLLDPRTGYPVEGLAAVTVLADRAMMADALSTALFILGPREGADLLRRNPGSGALYITPEPSARLLLTPDVAARFTPHPAWKNRIEALLL